MALAEKTPIRIRGKVVDADADGSFRVVRVLTHEEMERIARAVDALQAGVKAEASSGVVIAGEIIDGEIFVTKDGKSRATGVKVNVDDKLEKPKPAVAESSILTGGKMLDFVTWYESLTHSIDFGSRKSGGHKTGDDGRGMNDKSGADYRHNAADNADAAVFDTESLQSVGDMTKDLVDAGDFKRAVTVAAEIIDKQMRKFRETHPKFRKRAEGVMAETERLLAASEAARTAKDAELIFEKLVRLAFNTHLAVTGLATIK